MKQKEWYTTAEAAKVLGCHKNTIFYKAMNEEIPFERRRAKGGETVFISAETLEELRQERLKEVKKQMAILEAHPIQKRNQKGR